MSPHKATYYHDRFEKRRTSSGEIFSQKLYTAAHKTLPFHSIVKVTNKKNGRYVFVKINDRCARPGIIDLSKTAAKKINLLQSGTATVNIEVMGEEYRKIWEGQENMYAMFDRTNMNDYEQKTYMDSLVASLSNNVTIDYPIKYYIRIAITEGNDDANKVLNTVPNKYQTKANAEKIYNENFYYITIGPFENKDDGLSAVSELKRLYPVAHLVKKTEK